MAKYYRRLLKEGIENIIVLGVLNDTPDSAELTPLLKTSLKEITGHPKFTEFEFNARTKDRGIGTFATAADKKKIDYILLSPALWIKVKLGGIFRKRGVDRIRPMGDVSGTDQAALWRIGSPRSLGRS